MKKKSKIILSSTLAGVVILGAAGAIAGPVIYRDVIVGDAAAAPTLDAQPSASGAAADLNGQWVIGPGSYAGYRVDEVLNGTDVTVVGRTEQVTGDLSVSKDTLDSAQITVEVASIATDAAGRDDYFRSTTMNAEQYPTATFKLSEPVDLSGLGTDDDKVAVAGELTLAGATKPVTLELDAAVDQDSGQAVGQIPVTFADFGIEAPSLGFVKVQPQGTIEFSLNLDRS